MTKLTGHFDGKVIVPDGPVNLPENERLIIHVERTTVPHEPEHGTAASLARNLQGTISDEDAELMRQAIEEGCERIDPAPDLKFD